MRAPSLARLAAAAAAGAALSFSFAPWELRALAPLALLALYALLHGLGPRRAALIGFAFGLGCFGLGVSWVYHSLHIFGGAASTFAAALTALFVVVVALFPTGAAWAWARLRGAGPVGSAGAAGAGAARGRFASARSRARDAWLFAALWTLAELARGKVMGGFPWILVGYSQTDGPMGALAPAVGVYGIGLLLAGAAASALALALPATPRSRAGAALSIGLVVAASAGAHALIFSAPKARPLGVRLAQANIAQEMKFSPERLERSLREYLDLTLSDLPGEIDVVVWPETAIPTSFARVEGALAPWVAEFESRGVEVLAGGFDRTEDGAYNAVRQLGGARQTYRKRHIVPFGEYLPMRGAIEALVGAFIVLPGSDLSRGAGPHVPLEVAGESIGVSICYEDVFGEEMRALVPEAGVLVNVSNDAWFGDSAAPHQHEQKARMRARELARPMIRVTNTGVSSSISYDGAVEGRIAHGVKGTLDASVVPRTGTTWYARTGNWPVFAVALGIVALAGAARRSARRPADRGARAGGARPDAP